MKMAPAGGFEPPTRRLTAARPRPRSEHESPPSATLGESRGESQGLFYDADAPRRNPHRGRNVARWRSGDDRANVLLTPAYILDPVRRALGGAIGLDPCTEPDNPTGAVRYFALPTDGLAQDWRGSASIFCNPPYGDAAKPWLTRCAELGHSGIPTIALVPSSTDTARMQSALRGVDQVCWIAGRVKFDSRRPDGKPYAGHDGVCLLAWSADLRDCDLGVVMVPAS